MSRPQSTPRQYEYLGPPRRAVLVNRDERHRRLQVLITPGRPCRLIKTEQQRFLIEVPTREGPARLWAASPEVKLQKGGA
jgi:hypothetical protein